MEQLPGLVEPFPKESASEDTSPQRANSVRMYAHWRAISIICAGRTTWQRYLDVILGAVLVLAGVLKAQQLLVDTSVGRASGFPRWSLFVAAAFELAFGCWLLVGLYRRLTRWLALAWFTSLAAVAVTLAVSGAASCACFGDLHTPPWFILLFDVAAVASLWVWSPNDHSSRQHLSAALCLSLLPAAALFGLAGIPRDQTLFAEIDLGDIVRGGLKQQAFQCHNDSDALVEVAVIETSCPCASIRLERTGVPAGQLLAGNVTLDLRQEPDFVGNLAIDLKGLTRDGQTAFRLVIRARVYPAS